MDPVSISLGVAPLCLVALKGARALKHEIKGLRGHRDQLSRFRKRFETQMTIFRDESELLLKEAGVDFEMVEDMVDDFTHEDWNSEEVEHRIKGFLGRRYEEFKTISQEIVEQVRAFHEELSVLEDDSERHGKVRPLST